MHRTIASGHVSNLYVDQDPGNGVQGTVLVAADRNSIQEELCNAIEGAGLALSTANDSQLLAALRKGQGSSFDSDKLDGQEGAFYRDASNLNAGFVPAAQLDPATVRERLKLADGPGSGVDADLLDGKQLAEIILMVKDEEHPVNDTYLQFPGGETPAQKGLPGTWVQRYNGDGVFFCTSGTGTAFNGGIGEAQLPDHGHRLMGRPANFGSSLPYSLSPITDSGTPGDKTNNHRPYTTYTDDAVTGVIGFACGSKLLPRHVTVVLWQRTA